MSDLDELCINTLRFLSVDAVEKAKSGHPGLPLGAAPMAYVLWDRHLKHNPANPAWWNRDRFILAAGHGSALLYSLLHMTGYDLTIEDLKQFRQLGSRTPGHPEHGTTPGVEATTGPLGQGFAMGVGMAMAEAHLGARYNLDGVPIVDHNIYAIVSDGDLMEGISAEAASLAGAMGLGKIVYLYDNNHISLDGETKLTFLEDVPGRFKAYGWHVQEVADGNDISKVDEAIVAAKKDRHRPSLISVQTHIGYGSPKQDTKDAHGEPLGPEASKAVKQKLGWPLEPSFHVPQDARAHMMEALKRGSSGEKTWDGLLSTFEREHPDECREFKMMMRGELPDGWERALPPAASPGAQIATRDTNSTILNALSQVIPQLCGGSADLASSTKTLLTGKGNFSSQNYGGRNFHFGVRENAMAAAVNGMALHGGLIPYAGTFFTFTDYARPSIRFSALIGTRAIYIMTHDSVFLGEDGPTHQPIEHLASLRALPGLTIIRPADANEVRATWKVILPRRSPSMIVLTRQKVPILKGTAELAEKGVAKGAYVISDPSNGAPNAVIIGTGSEVALALAAKDELASKGVAIRVVSMPSWELFEEQPESYRREVLPADIPKVSVEAGATFGWSRYVGDNGASVGIDKFGASGPGNQVAAHLGINVENVVGAVRKVLASGHKA